MTRHRNFLPEQDREEDIVFGDLGLWGPVANLDSSGRREFRKNYELMPATKELIKKLENLPQNQSVMHSDVYNVGKSESIHAAILGAVRFTNINLIQMYNRMQRIKRLQEANRIILQTEAMALFEGNFIRVLKQIYTSEIINRIKKSIRFVMTLDEIDPVINRIRLDWWEYKDYVPSWEKEVMDKLTVAFGNVTDSEFEQEAMITLRDNPLNSSIMEEDQVERVFVKKKKEEITSPQQINFDSIKNIKF